MKPTNSGITFLIISLVASLAFGTLIVTVVVLATAGVAQTNVLLVSSIGFVVSAILGGIYIIIQTIREKRANKPHENIPTVATKSIGIRVNVSLGNESVVIEAPDDKSAIEVLQGIQENLMKSENHLSIESHSKIEQIAHEESEVSDTKETEN
jgi:hypothetical protein